jgi:hypothetical protein
MGRRLCILRPCNQVFYYARLYEVRQLYGTAGCEGLSRGVDGVLQAFTGWVVDRVEVMVNDVFSHAKSTQRLVVASM